MRTRAPRAVDPVVRSVAVFVGVTLFFFLARFFSNIVTPLVIALFLMLLIDALARAMQRRLPRAPAWIRDGLAGALIFAAFAAIGGVFALEGPAFAGQFADIAPRLDGALSSITSALHVAPVSIAQITSGIDLSAMLGRVFAEARKIVSEGVLVAIYFGFLLASRAVFGRKLDHLYDRAGSREAAWRVTVAVRDAVERYVRLQTFKALAMALVAWAVSFAFGVRQPLFMAFVVFLAAYVPIIGPIAGSIFPGLMALIQFGDLGHPILLVAILGTTVALIDNVVVPKVASDMLNIDPLLVLVSIGLWGAVLGAPGVLLSTPLTVAVMAVAAEFRSTRWLAVLISRDGDPLAAIHKARKENAER